MINSLLCIGLAQSELGQRPLETSNLRRRAYANGQVHHSDSARHVKCGLHVPVPPADVRTASPRSPRREAKEVDLSAMGVSRQDAGWREALEHSGVAGPEPGPPVAGFGSHGAQDIAVHRTVGEDQM